MTELTRRFFLGGAIALVAAQTFKPRLLASNLPKLWGDGIHDDTAGFNALFSKSPVIFSKDQIGVDGHDGIIIHKGVYKIDQTLEILDITKLEAPNGFVINAIGLPEDIPLISYDESLFNPSDIGFSLSMRDKRKVPLFKVKVDGVTIGAGNFKNNKLIPPRDGSMY